MERVCPRGKRVTSGGRSSAAAASLRRHAGGRGQTGQSGPCLQPSPRRSVARESLKDGELPSFGEGEPSRDDLISKLNASLDGPEPLSGEELRGLVESRWGRSYDTRICRRRDGLGQMRLYVQIMWKFLGQRSFPMSEENYDEQLSAVAELISEWGCSDQVRKEIPECPKNPVLDTTGANAVMIALDVPRDIEELF